MSQNAYAFIDGASFEGTANRILADFQTTFVEINWQALTRNAGRIFYFDALPAKKDRELEEDFQARLAAKKQHFSKLRRVRDCHVREGVSQSRQHSGDPALSQKGVDIALAVEALTHAHLGTIEIARIFASDRDFFPLLDTLTNTRVKTELFYDRRKSSDQIIQAADVAIELNHYFFSDCLPASKKAYYCITGLSEDISDYRKLDSGENKFGVVEILKSPMADLFVLRGRADETNSLCHMSRSKQLLIEHFEACVMQPVLWK